MPHQSQHTKACGPILITRLRLLAHDQLPEEFIQEFSQDIFPE